MTLKQNTWIKLAAIINEVHTWKYFQSKAASGDRWPWLCWPFPVHLTQAGVAGPTARVYYFSVQGTWSSVASILVPACASSSPAFLVMYSAYKLNKQGDNIWSWRTPFPIWNQSVVPCPVLTVASWPAYRFLKRQVRWSGIPISFRIFHSLLWSTQSKALA